MTGSITNIRAHYLGLALYDQTVVELADHACIPSIITLVSTKLDLLVGRISGRLWVLKIATNDLIPSHHNVRTLSWSANIPSVALSELRRLDVRL